MEVCEKVACMDWHLKLTRFSRSRRIFIIIAVCVFLVKLMMFLGSTHKKSKYPWPSHLKTNLKCPYLGLNQNSNQILLILESSMSIARQEVRCSGRCWCRRWDRGGSVRSGLFLDKWFCSRPVASNTIEALTAANSSSSVAKRCASNAAQTSVHNSCLFAWRSL